MIKTRLLLRAYDALSLTHEDWIEDIAYHLNSNSDKRTIETLLFRHDVNFLYTCSRRFILKYTVRHCVCYRDIDSDIFDLASWHAECNWHGAFAESTGGISQVLPWDAPVVR